MANEEETSARPELPADAGLARKMAAIQLAANVGGLEQRNVRVETSTGGSYSYDYITEPTLMRVIRPLLAEYGIAVFYSDEIKTMTGNAATVRVELTLVDGETGQERTMHAEGLGTDKGDKAVNKAKTSALRYLLWKWFLVPSDIDPEEENVERSDKQPKSHVAWATKEKVDAFIAAVVEAGYDAKPSQDAADAEYMEHDGWRQTWLDTSWTNLRRAIDQAAAQT